jgi:transcriptional regulator of acetoin/glycerol metabolism
MREEESATERSAASTNSGNRRSIVLRGALPDDDVFVRLTGKRWVLGRDAECDVPLDRQKVSRRHAEIVRQGPVLTIRDLGSTNGTNVDGKKIDHASLVPGAVVRIGEWLGVVEELEAEGDDRPFGEIAPGVWGGARLAQAVRLLELAAPTKIPVLLVGRTGSGKERFARALHHFSHTKEPFCALNCAALQPALAEAELFGYRKGSFTGADRSYVGQLRAAGAGTVFFDEVNELPAVVQAKLLRALDTGEVAPLGEPVGARFEARVVAASQERLSDLVKKGAFREDLAARLSGMVVELPELAERRADVPSLFNVFLREHSGGTAPPVSVRLYESLCLHTWPHNVRELELLARQLLAIRGMEPILRRSYLPEAIRESRSSERSLDAGAADRNDADMESLTNALQKAGGNVREAAAIAGISRQRAYRLIGSRRLTDLVARTREGSNGGGDGRED